MPGTSITPPSNTLKIGICHKSPFRVLPNHTAKTIKSGGLDVLASPVLIGWMEQCAWESVLPFLEQNSDTVGTHIEFKHLSPTPVHMMVECTCTLTHINNRELTFDIQATDETGLIASATHKRVIIRSALFQEKADSKKRQNT